MMNVRWNHQSPDTHADGWAASDPVFPQIATFSDEQFALAQIRRALQGRSAPARCEIVNVWYIPSRSLQVVYRLCAAEAAEGSVLTLQFWPRGASLAHYQAALDAGADPRAVAHLDGWDAVGWFFPADPQLPQLPALLDREDIGRRLSRDLGRSLDPGQLNWKLLSYLPGERCSLLYRFGDGAPAAIGKLQRGDAAIVGHRRMLQLWQAPGRRFRMPRPLELD